MFLLSRLSITGWDSFIWREEMFFFIVFRTLLMSTLKEGTPQCIHSYIYTACVLLKFTEKAKTETKRNPKTVAEFHPKRTRN